MSDNEPAKIETTQDPTKTLERIPITKEEFDKIYQEHQEWLIDVEKEVGLLRPLDDFPDGLKNDSRRANFYNRVFPDGFDFSNLNLQYANFQGAECYLTKFVETQLEKVNFQEAKCRLTKFNHAKLKESVFDGAELVNVDFTGADLSLSSFVSGKYNEKKEAKFTETCIYSQANLTGVKFPTGTNLFRDLDTFAESSKQNKRLVWLANLSSFVLLLAIFAKSQYYIELYGLKFSFIAFKTFLPFICLAIYLYVQTNLLSHWELVRILPSIAPDGLRIYQRLHPWLGNRIIIPFRAFLYRKDKPPDLSWLQRWMVVFTLWIFVPLAIFIAGIVESFRMGLLYDWKDIFYLLFRIVVFVMSVVISMVFYLKTIQVLQSKDDN